MTGIREQNSKKSFYKDFTIVLFVAAASIMVVISAASSLINGETAKELSEKIDDLNYSLGQIELNKIETINQ